MTTTGYQAFWTYNAVQARKNGTTIRKFLQAVYDHPYLGSKEFLTAPLVYVKTPHEIGEPDSTNASVPAQLG